jgi:hypothetical protein
MNNIPAPPTDAALVDLQRKNADLYFLNLFARNYVQQVLANKGIQTSRNYGDLYRLSKLVDYANGTGNYLQAVADLYASAYPDQEFAYMLQKPVKLGKDQTADSIIEWATSNPAAFVSVQNGIDQLLAARACMGAGRMSMGRMDGPFGLGTAPATASNGQQPYVFGSGLDPKTGQPLATAGSPAQAGSKYSNFLNATLGFLQGVSVFGDKVVSQYQTVTAPPPPPPPTPEDKSTKTAMIALGVGFAALIGVLVALVIRNRNKK